MPEPSVTAIVVGYNHASCLDRCLWSLGEQRCLAELEVLYLDNASTDRSLERAADHRGVAIIANPRNVGFAAAVNQGLARARGRYVALVNPDTALPPSTLRRLVDELERQPQLGAIAPALVGEDGREQRSLAPYPTLRALLGAGDGARWIVGAVIVCERDLLRELGGLDESYFVYGEDMDLCYRLQRRGRAPRLAPQVRVLHRGNPRWDADRLIRVYGAYLRFAGRHWPEERRALGLSLSLLWLARGVAARCGPGALLDGLRRIWSRQRDLPQAQR